MPPSLEALQRAFATAIVDARPDAAAACVIDDAPGAAARVAIFANHYRITLTDALAATFPVVRRLVGADFFAFAARRFIAGQPPREPRLFRYGAGLADFLAELPEAGHLVYLADVARLEWALNEAAFAEDAEALDAAALAALPATVVADRAFPLHPSATLLRSPWPIDRIWRLNQDGADPAATVDLDAGGVWLLVHRAGEAVGWIGLDPAAFALVEGLAAGRTLREAAEGAIAAHGGFDPTALFDALITAGALVASRRAAPGERP